MDIRLAPTIAKRQVRGVVLEYFDDINIHFILPEFDFANIMKIGYSSF